VINDIKTTYMKISLDKKEKYSILKLEEDNLNSVIAPDIKSEFVFLRNAFDI